MYMVALPGFAVPAHRYTYSDISQRVIPQAVEDAIYQQEALNRDSLSMPVREYPLLLRGRESEKI